MIIYDDGVHEISTVKRWIPNSENGIPVGTYTIYIFSKEEALYNSLVWMLNNDYL